MANQIRIKRRSSTGLAGAPASLLNAELAYNEADDVLYYGYGDNGSGVATSIKAIGGQGHHVTLATTQTISGAKTFSGDVDLTGAFKIDGAEVTASAAEINHLVGVTGSIQSTLNYLGDGVSNLQLGVGIGDSETDFGTATAAGFTGNTISDNATVKQALIDIEAALEGSNSDAVDLRTLSGTADGDTSFGASAARGFQIISSNATTLSALQELDAEVVELELNAYDLRTAVGVLENATDLGDFTSSIPSDLTVKAALENLGGRMDTEEGNVDDLQTLVGADNAQNLGAFTGGVIGATATVKEALQALESELVDGSGSLTADDSNTADFANGTVTISGGTGLSTTAANANELVVTLDDTTVSSGNYGSASDVATFTVDEQGRLTAASNVNIQIPHARITDFDAGVQENTLDSLAQPVASVAMNNNRITGLADPVGDQDAATKAYVDIAVQGLDVKDSVRVATVANINLSGTMTVDGVVLVEGDRILVKNQTDATTNGIYVVASGSWSRAEDSDTAEKLSGGAFTFVEEGSTHADAGFVCIADGPITLGTTALTFSQFSGAGQITAGAGMSKSGNTLDVGTASTARIVVNANDIDLATHGTAGTYNGLTVDAYGRVSSFTTPTTLAGYSITDAQPLDGTLTALAGLTVASDQMIYSTGADQFAVTSFTAFARSLMNDGDAATARTTLGLGSVATQDANNVAITGGTIDNITLDGGTF